MLVGPDYSDYWTTPDIYVNRFEDYVLYATSTEEGQGHSEQLLMEALAVGASMVPVYWLTAKLLEKTTSSWTPGSVVLLNVAVSAGLFHIISEETGVNNWFLTNSVAAKKDKKKFWRVPQYKVTESAAGSVVSEVAPSDAASCKGQCGWRACSGLDHSSFHQ